MMQIQDEVKSDQGINPQQGEIHNSSNASPAIEKYRLWCSKRFLLIILLFFGFLLAAGINVCINIVVIEMTTRKTIVVGNQTFEKPAEFNWDSKTIGVVQGCVSYAFGFASLGGYLVTKFGGCVTAGVGLAAASALTLLNPLCMELGGLYGFLACRIMAGFFSGVAYISIPEILARWIPVTERSRCMAIIFTAVYIAFAVSYPVFGYVAHFCGWKMVFYVAGGSTLIWSIIWTTVARNEPSADKFISKKELLYIANNAETTPRNEIVHPYRKIITSPAVWALAAGKVAYCWGYSMIVACLPLYVKDTTQRNLKEIGVISSIPNFACIFMVPLAGMIMDYLQNNTNLKPNLVHKMLMTFGYVTSSILFIVASLNTNFTVSMACFVFIKLFLSFNYLILHLICIYMAPKHSSILLGISAFWWVVGHSTVPSIVGFIVVNHSLEEWSVCFMVSAGMLMFGGIVYLIYGSSEVQPWAM